jgi:hypothetical protein
MKGRSKVQTTRRKYWVHHRFNKSDELGSIGVVRDIDLNSERFRSFYAGTRGNFFKFFPSLNNQALSSCTNAVFPNKLLKFNICFLICECTN